MDTRKIESEFKRIRALGFIKSKRIHNTGIGKTFEDYLGVAENNLKDPDFEGFEVKSHRFLSTSKITLFTKSPTYPEGANHYIREKYGNIDKLCKRTRVIHTSFFGDRFNTYLGKYAFKMQINKDLERVNFIIKELSKDKPCDEEIYYTFDDIMESTKKLDRLFVVTAATKTKRGKEYFQFQNAKIYLNFNLEKFLYLIEKGKIQYDIRIGAYKTGINKCKPHDHGSGFRIYRDNLGDLYETVIEIE
jgi:hypothetical protein